MKKKIRLFLLCFCPERGRSRSHSIPQREACNKKKRGKHLVGHFRTGGALLRGSLVRGSCTQPVEKRAPGSGRAPRGGRGARPSDRLGATSLLSSPRRWARRRRQGEGAAFGYSDNTLRSFQRPIPKDWY
uniref:Uncharacterized protein n=1 Tax=Ixodes ricinus TaxID=34613 RepID=A0A6B0URG6_IXORI